MSQPAAGDAAPGRRPWWLLPDRPALPVPTATELVAIRARVDALRPPPATRTRIGVGIVVGLVVAGLFAVDLVGGGSPGAWTMWALALVLGGAIASTLKRLVRQTRVDAAVRSRLAAEGLPTTTEHYPRLPLGRFGSGLAAVGVVGTVGTVLGVVSGLPAVRREEGTSTVLAVLAILVVLLAASIGAVPVLRTTPVGAGPVLEAVDAAVRRHRLLGLVTPVPLFAFLLVLNVDVHPARFDAVLRVCVIAAIAAAVGAQAGQGHEPLLSDYRLVTAREPKAWLTGEPA
jgi:hypothetical protein